MTELMVIRYRTFIKCWMFMQFRDHHDSIHRINLCHASPHHGTALHYTRTDAQAPPRSALPPQEPKAPGRGPNPSCCSSSSRRCLVSGAPGTSQMAFCAPRDRSEERWPYWYWLCGRNTVALLVKPVLCFNCFSA